jgi:hypothetical protein
MGELYFNTRQNSFDHKQAFKTAKHNSEFLSKIFKHTTSYHNASKVAPGAY